jgi:two-component system, response regulator YesN
MNKILVVEDELVIRKGLIHSVDWAALNCIIVGEADNGKEGLKLIENLKPDIVLLDIDMPIMDGLTMLIHANLIHDFKSIIISVHDDFEYAKEAIEQGSVAYILKPVNHDELKQAILKAQKELVVQKVYKTEMHFERQRLLVFPITHKNDSLIERINQYLEDNYSEKILLLDIAEKFAISTSQINAKLKKTYNLTFNHYLNRFRIQKAISLIKSTEFPIYEISIQCGYSEYKYFSTIFLKYVGMSPRQLKEYL